MKRGKKWVIIILIIAVILAVYKWVNKDSKKELDILEIELLEQTEILEKQDITTATEESISPKKLSVVKEEGEFYLVKTDTGEKWIRPNHYINTKGEKKLRLDTYFYLYDSNDLTSKTNQYVTPKLVTVVEDTPEWLRIKIGKDEKYIYKKEETKVAYLTIDDGPSPRTEAILNILKEHNAKATFFMLEPNMKKNPELVKQIEEEGHFSALHSVTHDKVKLYDGSPDNPAKEMEQTRQTLYEITGSDHYLVRMPFGSAPFMKEAYRDALAEYNFKMWDWTIDSNDWKYSSDNSSQIVTDVKNQLESVEQQNKEVVILMHGKPQTVGALPEIIQHLQSKGYVLIPYSPENHKVVNFWGDERL